MLPVGIVPLVLFLAGPAIAAAADSAGPPVDTIVVKAARIPLPEDRVGSSVSVISRDTIDQREASFASDLLREVPGVSVARTAGFGSQTQVRLWGAEASQSLVVIDGVEANDLAGNDEFSFEHLMTFDVDRIEVIRGPQSALWGSDALAGVINVVTRRTRKPFESEGFLEGGSFGTVVGGGRVGLARDGMDLAVSGSRYATDGINVSRTGSEKDGYGNTTVNLNAGYDATANVRFDLSARHTDARSDFDGTDFNTGLPMDTDDYSRTDFNYLRAGGKAASLDTRWTHDFHFTWTDTATKSFGGGASTSSQAGDKGGIYYQTSYRFAGQTEHSPDALVTLALDHELEQFRQRGAASEFGNPNQEQQLHTSGYVLEALGRPLPDLSLSVGARYDVSSDFNNVLTYRGTASYKIQMIGSRLHASYGTGQKSPTFIERFGYFPDQFVGNPNLKPERSSGWDLGVEQHLAEERLVLDATYFRARLEDEINGFAGDPATGKSTAVNLRGSSYRQGAQVSLRATAARGFSVTGSYTYCDATQPDGAGGQQREVRRPLHSASLGMNGNWLNGRLNVDLAGTYTGQRQDVFFPPPTFQELRVTLGSYALVNAAVSYQLTRMATIYARVENLFDKNYENVYGFNTPGIAGFAGVRVNFTQ